MAEAIVIALGCG